MAKEIPDLVALERTGTGKGAARQTRREGMVPGIVFGGETDPLPIKIPFNVLLKKLKAGRFKSTLFNLKVEGHDDVRVICRDVQRHVVKDLPTHLDLMRLHRNTKINLFIHVVFENEEESPGLKKGGVLTVVRPEVELVVTAQNIPEEITVDLTGLEVGDSITISSNIPEEITVDLTGLEVGDSITISSITLPSGAKPTIDRDFVIATLSAPSSLRSADDEEEADTDVEVATVAETEAEAEAEE